jgi:hypothetical protein
MNEVAELQRLVSKYVDGVERVARARALARTSMPLGGLLDASGLSTAGSTEGVLFRL